MTTASTLSTTSSAMTTPNTMTAGSAMTSTTMTTTASTMNTTASTMTNPTTIMTSSTMTTSFTTTSSEIVKKNYRLPKNLKPFLYEITTFAVFDILTEPTSFDGLTVIKFTCIESTNLITFHKVNLDFHSINVQSDQNELTILSTDYDLDTQLYYVTLDQPLLNNQNYSILINYSGIVESDNFGYFKSYYFDEDGKSKKWLIASQFEPVDARRAFPCFDEPSMKAQFKISVIHNKKHNVLSNMPINNTIYK